LKAAEIEVTKSKADRAERAKEVTEALKTANEATNKANKLLAQFVKDYGSFKTTLTDKDVDLKAFNNSFSKYFTDLFNLFW
jgi:hypothetical protein